MVGIALGGLAEQEVPQCGGEVCLRARKSRKSRKGIEANASKREQRLLADSAEREHFRASEAWSIENYFSCP